MSTDVPTRRRDVRAGVPAGAAPPSAAPVEHDLPGPALGRAHRPGLTGAFGPGFWSLLDLALVPDDGLVVVQTADRRLRFLPTSRGWVCSAGPHHDLTVDARRWRLEVGVGRRAAVATFDALGRLTSWRSEASSLLVQRDGRGRAAVVVQDGRRLHLTWDDDRVVRAETDDGHVATYTYASAGRAAGRLVRVDRPDSVVSYRWRGDAVTRRHLTWLP